VTGGERVVIVERFQGPPGSANGGYVCGLLAARMAPGPLRVTLRRPVPLERPLALAAIGRDGLALVQAEGPYAVLVDDEHGGAATSAAVAQRSADAHGRGADPAATPETAEGDGEVLVEAIAGESFDIGPVPEVDLEAARAVQPDQELLRAHPFPRCFGCGPERDPADAVALHLGRLSDEVWAASWTPGEGLPHERGGGLAAEAAWTALDCPSSFATVPAGSPPHVLGRLEGWVHGQLSIGDELVVIAWPLGHEGRKRWGATAIIGANGAVRAHARATWIALAA
jgi:hypothetical protein